MPRISSSSTFTKANAIDPSIYNSHDLIKRNDLVRLIAQLARGNNNLNTYITRVNTRLAYYVKKKSLNAPISNEFIFGEVMFWARSQWPGVFDELPVIYPEIIGTITATLPTLTMNAHAISLPTNIEACQQELLNLHRRIQDVTDQLSLKNAEISELKPDAERHREVVKINRENGKKKKY